MVLTPLVWLRGMQETHLPNAEVPYHASPGSPGGNAAVWKSRSMPHANRRISPPRQLGCADAVVLCVEGESKNLGGPHSVQFNQGDPITLRAESAVHGMREFYGLDARVFSLASESCRNRGKTITRITIVV